MALGHARHERARVQAGPFRADHGLDQTVMPGAELGQQRHRGAVAAHVHQAHGCSAPGQHPEHPRERGDPDAPGDQDVAGPTVVEREVLPGAGDPHAITHPQPVHVARTPAPVRGQAHRDPDGAGGGVRVHHRVRADPVAAVHVHSDVDVAAGGRADGVGEAQNDLAHPGNGLGGARDDGGVPAHGRAGSTHARRTRAIPGRLRSGARSPAA